MPSMAWIKAIPLIIKGLDQKNKLRQFKDISNFWAKARKIPMCHTTAMNGSVSHFPDKKTFAFYTTENISAVNHPIMLFYYI